LGAEYGADFIKSPYKGDPVSFRKKVVDSCYKPIVALGGGANKSDSELLQMVRDAIDSGCKGVAIGRNIWKHKKIERLCRAISLIIHEDLSVERGLELIASK
jgi:DhnA family fructose-bisphosphate aldolase class Ia